LIKIGKAQGLSFCDETLPNLTKGKNTHTEGEREEQKERTNVPTIVEHPSAQKHNGDVFEKTLMS
jgi:hypothetical protein